MSKLDDVVEFVGGALDGVWRYVGPFTHEYLVPVPVPVHEVWSDVREGTITSQIMVHRYVRTIYGNRITGRRIAKMVFAGEERR